MKVEHKYKMVGRRHIKKINEKERAFEVTLTTNNSENNKKYKRL